MSSMRKRDESPLADNAHNDGSPAVHGLLQLRVHFVCDGHNVWQHLAEIHSSRLLKNYS